MITKKSWITTKELANHDTKLYFNLTGKVIDSMDPKQLRITKSIAKLSTKIVRLEESVSRIDRLIKEGIV
jgi:hypothetical protein